MQITSNIDVEAPLAAVFAALTDFDRWEQAMIQRGAAVSRTDTRQSTEPGPTWAVRLAYRGKDRDLSLRLVMMDPSGKLALSGTGDMLLGDMVFDLAGLASDRTRLVMRVDLRATTLGGRLLLQTLSFGRGAIEAKLNTRLLAFALEIETHHATATTR
jgi:hypothetical protein